MSYYLLEQRKEIDPEPTDEYYRRWQSFVEETVNCGKEEKVWWFLYLASMSVDSWMKKDNAAVLEKLILDDPACAVRGMRDLFTPTSQFIASYLMKPSHHNIDELDAALRTVLEQPEFAAFAKEYQRQFEQRRGRIAAEEAAREARAARERQAYWGKLRDRRFYDSSYDDFIQRWHELVLEASCDNQEQLKRLFDTAKSYAADERIRQVAGEKVAHLAVQHPACVLGIMEKMHGIREFIDTYLVDTPNASDIYHALFGVKESFIRTWTEYIQRVHGFLVLGADLGIDGVMSTVYPSHYKSFADGRVYVPMPYRYGAHQEKMLAELWQSIPDGDHRDAMGEPIKIVSHSAVAFMERESYDSYYLLNVTEDGVDFLPASVVEAAISLWACGSLLPLLVLEPESHPDWLTPLGIYPVHGASLGVPADFPVPAVEKVRWPDNYTYHGTFYWEQSKRKYDFSYTDAYVDLEFSLVESKNLMPYSVHNFPTCH